MKKIGISFFVALFAVMTSFAQTIEVTNGDKTFSQGTFNAYTIELSETNKQTVEKAWMNYIKDYKGKIKFNKRTSETFSDNTKIEGMSENVVDVYAIAVSLETTTQLNVWFDLGGAYSNTDNEKTDDAARSMLHTFGVEHYKGVVKRELVDHEKVLKDKENQLKDLEKQKKDYLAKIEELKQEIVKMQKKVTTNDQNQVEKRTEIQAQKSNVHFVEEKLRSIN